MKYFLLTTALICMVDSSAFASSSKLKACQGAFSTTQNRLDCVATRGSVDVVRACAEEYFSPHHKLQCMDAHSVAIVDACKALFDTAAGEVNCIKTAYLAEIVEACSLFSSQHNRLSCVSKARDEFLVTECYYGFSNDHNRLDCIAHYQ